MPGVLKTALFYSINYQIQDLQRQDQQYQPQLQYQHHQEQQHPSTTPIGAGMTIRVAMITPTV